MYEALDKIFFFDFFCSFKTSMSKTTNPKILGSNTLPMKSQSIPTFSTITSFWGKKEKGTYIIEFAYQAEVVTVPVL